MRLLGEVLVEDLGRLQAAAGCEDDRPVRVGDDVAAGVHVRDARLEGLLVDDDPAATI